MTTIGHGRTVQLAAHAAAREALQGLRVTRILTVILLLSVCAVLTARCNGGPNRNNGGQYNDAGIR